MPPTRRQFAFFQGFVIIRKLSDVINEPELDHGLWWSRVGSVAKGVWP